MLFILLHTFFPAPSSSLHCQRSVRIILTHLFGEQLDRTRIYRFVYLLCPKAQMRVPGFVFGLSDRFICSVYMSVYLFSLFVRPICSVYLYKIYSSIFSQFPVYFHCFQYIFTVSSIFSLFPVYFHSFQHIFTSSCIFSLFPVYFYCLKYIFKISSIFSPFPVYFHCFQYIFTVSI